MRAFFSSNSDRFQDLCVRGSSLSLPFISSPDICLSMCLSVCSCLRLFVCQPVSLSDIAFACVRARESVYMYLLCVSIIVTS